MTWNKVYPLTTTNICASVTQTQANFAAIESVMSAEHGSYFSALSGTHLYGRCSVMFSGTYSAIKALTGSSPTTGALAFDTECGVCRIYDGETWPRISAAYFSRLHAYTSTAQSIPATTWTSLTLTTESYDSLAEFTVTTGVITIANAGWYLIVGTITWPTETSTEYQKAAGIYVGSSRKTSSISYGKEVRETEVADIINLSASSTITLRAYHSYTSNISIVGANLMLTRLS
jgi:hypothetical protein